MLISFPWLVFPVSRVHRKLRLAFSHKKRIGPTPAIYLAAVLEYLVAELLELAGDVSNTTVYHIIFLVDLVFS